jgi:hypothetical protein
MVLAAKYSDNLQHEYTVMTSHNNVETGVLFLLGSSLLLGGGLLLGGSLLLRCGLLLGGLLSEDTEDESAVSTTMTQTIHTKNNT